MNDFNDTRMNTFLYFLELIIKGKHSCYGGQNPIDGYCPGCAKEEIKEYDKIILNKIKELNK